MKLVPHRVASRRVETSAAMPNDLSGQQRRGGTQRRFIYTYMLCIEGLNRTPTDYNSPRRVGRAVHRPYGYAHKRLAPASTYVKSLAWESRVEQRAKKKYARSNISPALSEPKLRPEFEDSRSRLFLFLFPYSLRMDTTSSKSSQDIYNM